MTATRDDLIERARELADLGADPADPDRRAEYLELIAPSSTASQVEALATVSGCALVVRGLWRDFIDHPLLEAPYRLGHAVTDLIAIANQAGAATSALTRAPEVGDAIVVGGGPDGGGVEHVFTVLAVTPNDEDQSFAIEGLDGGQRDPGGHQVIRVRDHVIEGGRDKAGDASDPGGGASRKVRWVIDVAAILDKFGR